MNYIKNQMEIVELKSINAEMKNSVEELSSTFELAELKISGPEDRSIRIVWS